MDRIKRIWYLSPMRAAKVQASLRIRAVSPEPSLLAHRNSESRGTLRQKVRSLALLNGWACAGKICHDGMLEDTNSLDGAHMRSKKVHISAPLLSPALDSKTPKLATCQYFTRDKYVPLAFFRGNSFFQMMWLANFQLADLQLANYQLAHYPDSVQPDATFCKNLSATFHKWTLLYSNYTHCPNITLVMLYSDL